MSRNIRKSTTLLSAAAMVMTLGIGSAVADHGGQTVTAPAAAECSGTADVWTGDPDIVGDGDGLTFPHVDDRRSFNWKLTTDCEITIDAAGSTAAVSLNASGTGEGWCGQSFGLSGSGTIGDAHLTNITWNSAGTVLAVEFDHDAGATGTGSAEVQAFGGTDCDTLEGAKRFDVEIVGELL